MEGIEATDDRSRLLLDRPVGLDEQELNESLDLRHVADSTWLVKVPNFVLERWNQLPKGTALGSLQLTSRDECVGCLCCYNAASDAQPEMALLIPSTVAHAGQPDEIPADFDLRIGNQSSRNLFVFSERDVTDMPALRGTVVHEGNIVPKLGHTYQRIMQKRQKLAQEPKRTIKTLDESQAKQNQLAGGLASHRSTSFIKLQDKVKGERNFRMPKNELLDLLFGLFAKSDHLSVVDINKQVKQPLVYLKEVLNGIAAPIPNGPYVGQYKLLAEYRKDEPTEDDLPIEPGASSAPQRIKTDQDDSDEEMETVAAA